MDVGDEILMGRRLGQLTGLLMLVLVIARLGRLLQTGPSLPRWHLILIASTFLGGVVWWLARQITANRALSGGVLAAGGAALLMRVAVPSTLVGGVIPTVETLPQLSSELDSALRLIRSGVPPVFPEQGLLGILAVLMWCLGAIYAYGMMTVSIAVMVIPIGVVYLQFAVFDRQPAGLGWMTVSGIALALALTAVALDRRQDVGRARDQAGLTMPRRGVGTAAVTASVVAVVAIATAGSASTLVSEYGNVPWRSGVGGAGPGSGGVAFDRFVDLRQRLLSRDNVVLFRATLAPEAPPASQLYWRMETLDTFDGVSWRRSNTQIRNYEPGRAIGDDRHAYQGSTADVLQRVYIDRLAGELAPTAGVPDAIHEIADQSVLNPRSFRIAEDAALYYPQGLRPEDNYQVQATYPLHDVDLGRLATGAEGSLSPIFASAAAAGLFSGSPSTEDQSAVTPIDLDTYTRLPDDLPAGLTSIARSRTAGSTTDFERAWILQHWFRESGDFTYSQQVSTGHGALVLEDWLTDSTSRNYRTGYCEQFAAAMAVLGRALGIPSRVVWGFTPGEVTTTETGIEVIEVRDTNAHAWVEMWMDPVGWVRFDPTPRGEFQPDSMTAGFDPDDFVSDEAALGAIGNPVTPGINDPDADGLLDDPALLAGEGGPRWWLLLIPAIVVIAAIVPALKRLRRSSRLKALREGDITAAWDEIVDRLTDLGEPLTDSLTPMELARATDNALLPLAVQYSAAVYGGRTGSGKESDLVTVEWWMRTRFDGTHRMRGALNPRSLLSRRN